MIDTATYNNFTKANPTITPNGQDFSIMAGASPSYVPSVNTTMNASTLGQTNPLNLTTKTTPPVPDISMLGQVTAPTLTPPPAPTIPQQSTGLFSRIAGGVTDLFNQSQNKASDLTNSTLAATSPYQSQIDELNSQMKQHQAQAIANQEKALQSGESMGYASREAQNIQRTDAINGLFLQSRIDSMQGNLDSAKRNTEIAINQKYADINSKLQDARANIINNYDSFTAAEKKRADKTLLMLDSQDAFAKSNMENDKIVQGIINTAIVQGQTNGNPVPNIIQTQAQALSDPTAVTSLLAPYLTNAQEIQKAIDAHNVAQANIRQSNASANNSDASANKTRLETQLLNSPSTNSSISQVTGKPLSDSERTSLGYAERAKTADSVITQLGGQFLGSENVVKSLLPNVLKSSEMQQFEQAQRNFVNSVLRKESGAAISPSEFDSASKQYFPQPGDNQAVVEQKTANRQQKINSLYLEGGQKTGGEVQSNGSTFKVGQVYQDASGSKWTVDASGKWTKQ